MEQILGTTPDTAPIEGVERHWVFDDLELRNGFVTVRHQLVHPEDLENHPTQEHEYPVTYRMTVAEWREKCRSEFGLNEDGTEVNDDNDDNASGE